MNWIEMEDAADDWVERNKNADFETRKQMVDHVVETRRWWEEHDPYDQVTVYSDGQKMFWCYGLTGPKFRGMDRLGTVSIGEWKSRREEIIRNYFGQTL